MPLSIIPFGELSFKKLILFYPQIQAKSQKKVLKGAIVNHDILFAYLSATENQRMGFKQICIAYLETRILKFQ